MCTIFANLPIDRSHEENEDEEVYVSQEGVHRAIGAEIVNNVLNGVSASCFAYGHTGESITFISPSFILLSLSI